MVLPFAKQFRSPAHPAPRQGDRDGTGGSGDKGNRPGSGFRQVFPGRHPLRTFRKTRVSVVGLY